MATADLRFGPEEVTFDYFPGVHLFFYQSQNRYCVNLKKVFIAFIGKPHYNISIRMFLNPYNVISIDISIVR